MDFAESHRPLERFVESGVDRPTLGLVYGRRRIGKSTLLEAMSGEKGGFYWEATRGETAIHLSRLGDALGARLGAGRLAFDSWEEAIARLLALGPKRPTPVVLDDFGYLLESEPGLPSVIAAALGSAGRRSGSTRTRLILCGSAITVMRALTAGEAPLRGRAGLEVVMQPLDFRRARDHHGRPDDLELAIRVFAVIGGVIGYATDMVDHDLPASAGDFDRWVAERVLSPAATLHHEATTLLAEDPALAGASPAMHHSILSAIANGSDTAGTIANRLRRSVPNLAPALNRLVSAGFVIRHEDPIRSQRPLYALADPFLQFHYAVLEPHGRLLRDRNPVEAWERTLAATFDSRVRGPVFEEQARQWVRRWAEPETIGGEPMHVGPSYASIEGTEHRLDILVAGGEPGGTPADRPVVSIGEAKAGERITLGHLQRLEAARSALGPRAARARLLLVGPRLDHDLQSAAGERHDVELVDLERLYGGG